MGACNCESGVLSGCSANEVYDGLVSDCISECGHDPYNGTFSTCNLVRMHKIADKFSEKNVKAGRKLLYDLLNKGEIGKWSAHGVDLGVDHYEIIRPKMKKNTGTLKAMFCVTDSCDRYSGKFSTLKDAQEYAMKLATKMNTEYYISKRYCYPNGNETIATVENNVRICKSKPKTTPKGAVVREIHKYYFVGLAAC